MLVQPQESGKQNHMENQVESDMRSGVRCG